MQSRFSDIKQAEFLGKKVGKTYNKKVYSRVMSPVRACIMEHQQWMGDLDGSGFAVPAQAEQKWLKKHIRAHSTLRPPASEDNELPAIQPRGGMV